MTLQQTSSKPRVGLIFAVLMIAMLMSSLGQMIFVTALPTIVGELGGVNHMTWVITAFLLGETIALPIFGKLGDQIGRKPLFIAATILFIVGSLLGGFATSMGLLIFSRAIQGIAAGALMILSQAIVADVVSARDRGHYMGIMGAVFGVASVLGPVLGGWFTDGPGWRWGLWFNVPLGVLALAGILLFLQIPRRGTGFHFDWAGTLTMVVSTTCLILGITWDGNEYEWTSPVILGLFTAALIAGTAFVIIELRTPDALLPMMLFTSRNFVLTTVAGLAVGVFMFGALGYLPTYLQMVHSLSPTTAGLMMTPMMAGMMGTSTLVGNLITRTGRYKWYPVSGMIITTAALVMLSRLQYESSLITVGAALFLLGVGLGCTMQILVLIVQNSFPITMVGTATAANNFFRQIGGSLGSALVGGLFVGNLANELKVQVPIAMGQLSAEEAAAAGQHFTDGANDLTPALVAQLPDALRIAVDTAYNDALTPVFLLLAPLALAAAALLIGVREDQLKSTIA